MKAVAAFFVGALLCVAQKPAAQKPANCWDSQERLLHCAQAGDAVSQFGMGLAYEVGTESLPQDYTKAADWYRLAALQGHPQAQANLGRLYAAGAGVPRDLAEAFRWTRMAAENGIVSAQAETGVAYLYGFAVVQDYKAATKWLRKAAERGDAQGEVALGDVYESGKGVPKDYVQAHTWYNLASAQGATGAGKARDELAAKMTPAQIAEAQRLAREFKAKTSNEGTAGR
jgi:uncharacterized protein